MALCLLFWKEFSLTSWWNFVLVSLLPPSPYPSLPNCLKDTRAIGKLPVGVDDGGGWWSVSFHGGHGFRGWTTCGVAGSELSVSIHYLIQSPGQALGILVLQIRNLIWMHEKFKEIRYLVPAFKLHSLKSNTELSSFLACALSNFLNFFLGVRIGWLQHWWVDKGTQIELASPNCSYTYLPCLLPQWVSPIYVLKMGHICCLNPWQAWWSRDLALGERCLWENQAEEGKSVGRLHIIKMPISSSRETHVGLSVALCMNVAVVSGTLFQCWLAWKVLVPQKQ